MPAGETDTDARSARSSLRFELLFGAGLVLCGLILLPPLIYMVGVALLGAYGGGGHLGSFYGDVFRDLGQGSPQAWALVLGPFLLVEAGRLVLFNFGARGADFDDPTTATERSPVVKKAKAEPRERREPTLRL